MSCPTNYVNARTKDLELGSSQAVTAIGASAPSDLANRSGAGDFQWLFIVRPGIAFSARILGAHIARVLPDSWGNSSVGACRAQRALSW
eukprot:6137392-Alexandrium_andersonii.AAC.1